MSRSKSAFAPSVVITRLVAQVLAIALPLYCAVRRRMDLGNGRRIPQLDLDRLVAWNRTYEAVRTHVTLGCKTPDQFFHHRLGTDAVGK